MTGLCVIGLSFCTDTLRSGMDGGEELSCHTCAEWVVISLPCHKMVGQLACFILVNDYPGMKMEQWHLNQHNLQWSSFSSDSLTGNFNWFRNLHNLFSNFFYIRVMCHLYVP